VRRCGLLIATRTLEVQADYSRYADTHLASTITMPPGMVQSSRRYALAHLESNLLGFQCCGAPAQWGSQAVKPTACTDRTGKRKVLIGDVSRTLTCCGSPTLMCYSCKLRQCAFEVVRRSPGTA